MNPVTIRTPNNSIVANYSSNTITSAMKAYIKLEYPIKLTNPVGAF